MTSATARHAREILDRQEFVAGCTHPAVQVIRFLDGPSGRCCRCDMFVIRTGGRWHDGFIENWKLLRGLGLGADDAWRDAWGDYIGDGPNDGRPNLKHGELPWTSYENPGRLRCTSCGWTNPGAPFCARCIGLFPYAEEAS